MDIAVTGEGIISAIGNNKAETLRSLQDGLSGIGMMRHLRSSHTYLPVGEVKMSNLDMKRALSVDPAQTMSRTALMAIIAIKEALDDAGLRSGQGSKRTVLVSGTTVGGMDITEEHFGKPLEEEAAVIAGQHDCGNCSNITARYFGRLFDDVITISTACSSAANAIMIGARLIKDGKADIVVAGGSEALTRFHLNGFNSLMILDHDRCRPFDASRAGLNLGEGAAYVVLEPAHGASSRGAEPHAWVSGYGNACDAFHQTATSSNGEGATRAMSEALAVAGLKPSDIDYVNAHGTATINNDQSETEALKRVFGQKIPHFSSTKAFTGHATSAAGGIEAVICLMAMRHGFIPANIGWTTIMPGGLAPSMGATGSTLRHVMCNSFGFGGNDTSLIFSSCPTQAPAAKACGSEIRMSEKFEIKSVEDLADIKRYVKTIEARRMGRLMKAAFITSKKALEAAGIDTPDAIITATAYGCVDNSERILFHLLQEGETAVSPTLFMQSTHNTIGSDIAIRLGCHGYNITYTQCERSLQCAINDAMALLASGKCHSVLVGAHDETTPTFSSIIGDHGINGVYSISMVFTCGKS